MPGRYSGPTRAAASASDGEEGVDVLLLGPVQEIILDRALRPRCVRVSVAPAGRRNWTSALP